MAEFTLKELIARLQDMQDEIGERASGGIGSHDRIKSRVMFRSKNPDDNGDYELESLYDIEPDMIPGCGCWAGVWFVLNRTED